MNAINQVFQIKDIIGIIGEFKYYFELIEYIENDIYMPLISRYMNELKNSEQFVIFHYFQNKNYHIEFLVNKIGYNIIKLNVYVFYLNNKIVYEYIENSNMFSKNILLDMILNQYSTRFHYTKTNKKLIYFIKNMLKNKQKK